MLERFEKCVNTFNLVALKSVKVSVAMLHQKFSIWGDQLVREAWLGWLVGSEVPVIEFATFHL